MVLIEWEPLFIEFMADRLPVGDPAHDLAHVRRLAITAHALALAENAVLEVVLPAAWLHDCIVLPKDSDQRPQASRLAAAAAAEFLQEQGYSSEHIPAIHHAIESHSFSAGIPPQTLEARVVQDADRLDAIGAIGIARCLSLGGVMGKPLYDPDEPFPEAREPDDTRYTLDHFYVKLLKLAGLMQTSAGRREAERRTEFTRIYLAEFYHELKGGGLPGRAREIAP
jgi:uncharacterized protein